MHKHEFIPFGHPQYEQCSTCGTLHSVVPFPRENYLDNYWGNETHSTLEEQRWNLEFYTNEHNETKVDSVLKYCKGESILEIACAPGSFLKKAREMGFRCLGVEPSEKYSWEIENYSGCEVATCFFEDLSVNEKFDNIVAMDLIEHLEDGQDFIQECLSLLNDGGRLILMAPFIYIDKRFSEKNFHPEHLWLYSQDYLAEWLKPMIFDRFETGHEFIVIEK